MKHSFVNECDSSDINSAFGKRFISAKNHLYVSESVANLNVYIIHFFNLIHILTIVQRNAYYYQIIFMWHA